MRSLWKISRRYVMTAIFAIFIVLVINFIVLLYSAGRQVWRNEGNFIGRQLMENLGEQISVSGGTYHISPAGEKMLEASSFIWAMRLDACGKVVWSSSLPDNFPQEYSVADVAAFSRWYFRDYPVRVWRDGDELMVYGMEKDSITRLNMVYDVQLIEQFPSSVLYFLFLNLLLILVLALLFSYRFYRSLRPIAEGIEGLSRKERVTLPEKGITDELAGKLNRTSVILRQQDEKLEQRDHARTSWIAGVSHDIRTPLALITGYSDALMSDDSLAEESKKKAEIIREQSLIIRRLIADLNLTSKLEYHAQPLRQSWFSPAVLLRECVAEYYNQGMEEPYSIDIQVEPEAEKKKVYGDTALLLRSFRNLIGNSVRHNPDGCDMTIRLASVKEEVRYEFSDTGAGIAENVVRALDNGGEAPPDGVHVMGLHIVSQIASAHGGLMEFVKRESGTYDVRVILPAGEG